MMDQVQESLGKWDKWQQKWTREKYIIPQSVKWSNNTKYVKENNYQINQLIKSHLLGLWPLIWTEEECFDWYTWLEFCVYFFWKVNIIIMLLLTNPHSVLLKKHLGKFIDSITKQLIHVKNMESFWLPLVISMPYRTEDVY